MQAQEAPGQPRERRSPTLLRRGAQRLTDRDMAVEGTHCDGRRGGADTGRAAKVARRDVPVSFRPDGACSGLAWSCFYSATTQVEMATVDFDYGRSTS